MRNLTPDQLIAYYVSIRDAKEKANEAFKKETERMNEALAKLEGILQEKLDELGLESFNSAAGTAYSKVRNSATVKDRDTFYQWCVDNDELGAIDIKANAKAVRELLDNGVDVPGVKFTSMRTIGVRRKSQ